MYNKLIEEIKHIKGNVLVMCLDDKLLDAFNKNNNVNLYSISNDDNQSGLLKKSKRMKANNGKNINIKKLKKYINKKTVDYILINMEKVMTYYKYIIRDTIYLNRNKIIIYLSDDIDKDFVISRYKRYNVDVEVTKYKNGYIIDIKNNDNKNHLLKNKVYFIKDTFYNIAEFIGNILVS